MEYLNLLFTPLPVLFSSFPFLLSPLSMPLAIFQLLLLLTTKTSYCFQSFSLCTLLLLHLPLLLLLLLAEGFILLASASFLNTALPL